MSKQNKVATNLQQDFTTEEQKQARDNISASQIAYIQATGGTPTTEVGDLFVVQYQSGKKLSDGSGDLGYIVPNTVSGDTGCVLTETELGPRWKHLPEIPEGETWKQIKSTSAGNTHLIDYYVVCDRTGDNSYDKMFGYLTMTTTSSGSFSIVPLNDNNELVHGSQCMNISGVPTGYPMTYGFMFDSQGQHDITHVGIKGSGESSNASIIDMRIMFKK